MTQFLHKKPPSKHYYQEGVPSHIDSEKWNLEIIGLGQPPLSLSYQEILRLPQVEQNRRMVCVCNWSIRRRWRGVLLSTVLQMADLLRKDLFLRQISIGNNNGDYYVSTIPLRNVEINHTLLCHTVDGKPLPLEQGFPLRLIDFTRYGYKSVKGLKTLEIVEEFRLGHWEAKAGYELEGIIQPKKYWIVDLQDWRYVENYGEVVNF